MARHSYGRQIGRIADVSKCWLSRSTGGSKDPRLTDFLTMKHEIDRVKQGAAAARIEQITKDMALLKTCDQAEYVRLRDALLEALQ